MNAVRATRHQKTPKAATRLARPKTRATASAEPPRGFAYLRHRHDALTSLVLTIPVFVFYHLGILFTDFRNGADMVSRTMFRLLRGSVEAYIAVTLAVAIGLVIAVVVLRRKGRLQPARFLPVIGESLVLSVLILVALGWTMGVLIAAAASGGVVVSMGPFEKLVMSAGAGFHEELIFRVGVFGGLFWLFGQSKSLGRRRAVLFAALASAVVFSSAHYVGPMGDQFAIGSFVARLLIGLIMVAIYHLRGFAVAVYTHTVYDVIVLFLFV